MKNSINTYVITCFFVISAISFAASADENIVLKANQETHVLKTQLELPLTQIKIPKMEGKVRFYNKPDNVFATNHIVGARPATQEWMVNHYERMQAYSPWFDEYTDWYGNGLIYKNMYAIYNCTEFECTPQWIPVTEFILDQHPEWILRDSDDNPLYLPYGCENGTCPQFAADIGNSEFRDYWINDLQQRLVAAFDLTGKGYHGIFVDDVNTDLAKSVVTSEKMPGNPINPNTGLSMEDEEWKNYVAEFVELIRTEVPGYEIVHNVVWYHTQPENEYLDRQIDAADLIGLERGINDPGMQAGHGLYGIQSFFGFSDYVHQRGRDTVHLVYQNELSCPPAPCSIPAQIQLEYGLSGWLLTSGGDDLFGSTELNTPDNWWHGFDINLGNALGERHEVPGNNLLQRDFENGIVLLNGPDTTPITVDLPETFYTLNGDSVNQVKLASRRGKILLRNPLPRR